MFASCGNIDNPLEEMGGEDEPAATSFANLKEAMAAIEDGAEIEIGYTVYGKTTQYTVVLKKVGEEFVWQKDDSELPTGLDYELKGEIEVPVEGDDAGKLVFTLTASATEAWYEEYIHIKARALTRGQVTIDDFVRKVMVITFDPESNTYDVVSTPGFTFKVLNVKGLPVEIEDANECTATINITTLDESTIPYIINFKEGDSWAVFAAKYIVLKKSEGENYNNKDFCIVEDGGYIYIHIGLGYKFIYDDFAGSDMSYLVGQDIYVGPNEEIEDNGHYMATLING